MSLAELNFQPDEIRALYLIHLQQLYSAESQALDALPNLALHLSVPDLRQRLLLNAIETPEHLRMLENSFIELAEEPTDQVCEPMEALISFGAALVEQHPYGSARDLLLVGVAKEMKHLGIAKYTMAETFAQVLGYEDQGMRFSKPKGDEELADRELNFSVMNMRLTKDKP